MHVLTPCNHRNILLLLFLAAIALPQSTLAEPSEALDNISIAIGGYITRPNINLGVDTSDGEADTGDISTHRVTLPRAHVDFLLGESQGFAIDYYGFYNRYSDSFSPALSSLGNGVSINGSATGDVNFDVGNLSYKWWLGHEADVFGIGIGAAYYRVHLGANVNASSSVGNTSGSASASYEGDTVAPLVQIGWRHAFSPNVRIYVDASGVEKDGGKLNGHIYNGALGVEWYFLPYVGIGAEYDSTRVRIDDAGNNATLNLRLNGPTIFIKARL